jgi:mRNA degradation ribonuclease J1/J2
MDHFGMYKFQCHCSGHARSRDLLQIVDEINACTLYPVHTEHQKYTKELPSEILDIQDRVQYGYGPI